MKFRTKSLNKLSTIIICFTIIYLPFYDTRNLFKSYITEKVFLFAAVTGVLLLIQALIILFNPKQYKGIKITWVDLALFALVAYLSLNRFFVSEMGGITLKYYRLIVLCIFYIIIRNIPSKYYPYFIYSLLISGIIQAVYGNLQLYDVYPSKHHLFNITGSFFNPGPYSGYLAMIFPIALVIYLKNRKIPSKYQLHLNFPKIKSFFTGYISLKALNPILLRFKNNLNRGGTADGHSEAKQSETILGIKHYFEKHLSFLAIATILLVIPATRSRASWLAIAVSAIYITINYQPIKLKLKKFLSTKRRTFLFVSGIIFMFAIFLSGIYYFKKDSADGRLLIWKVSSLMIKDKPLFGHGYEKFQANYMDYQSSYFEGDPENEESYVADDIIYPFNEYIKLVVESGILGICLIMAILFFAFLPGENEEKDINSFALQAGILGLMIFAFFSYPGEILSMIVTLTILLALLAREKGIVLHKRIIPEQSGLRRHGILKCSFSITLIILVIGMYFPYKRLYQAYFLWDEGYKIYQMNAYDECLESFEESYDIMKNNGDYLIMYGKALSMAEKNKEAIEILRQAQNYQKNTILYTAMGTSHKELGQIGKAESAYNKAYFMIPSRFYPKYLLAKLYEETDQYEKARIIANEILSKKEKIPSTAILEIKTEMEDMIKLINIEQLYLMDKHYKEK